MIIRDETPADFEAVYSVHASAFDTDAEAKLVEKLRQEGQAVVSLVAESGGQITGHILFSPVVLSEFPELSLAGLAPMAVVPQHQRSGIGSALIKKGLAECKSKGFAAVVVLGHPDYYPKFGFRPALGYGLKSEFEVPVEVFMAMELIPGSLSQVAGTIRYHEAFAAFE